jgi:DNA-binding beta-propeller fold protein YncE
MKRLLVPLLLVVTTASVGAGSTEASVSAPVYLSTIGGPGHAQIYASGLDVDAAGNVYVADTGNDQVKKFAPNGTLLWNVGVRGVKAPGNFDNPRDIAYSNGKLYVADLGNKRVQVLDASTGAVDAVWTETFPSTIGISAGVDGSGNPIILVTEDVLNQTRIYTPSGTFIRADGTGTAGSGAGQLNAPRDAATDSAGNVYVADYANNRIAKFGPTGAWITSWGTGGGKPGQFRRPYGVTVDVDNNVWVADSTNHRIQEFTSTGTFIRALGSSGTGSGQFFMLRRVAVTPGVSNPDVYGTDLWGNKIERFHYASGSYSWAQTYAGSHAPAGLFNEPAGVAVDGTNVFVADSVNQRMQRFATSTGAFQTTFGQRGWGSNDLTGMNWPRDIAIEGSDTTKVWVADTKNGRLLEFTRDGTPTGRTIGTQGSGLGQFNRVSAVASSPTGIVVADTFNNRVQLWNTSASTPSMVWNTTGFSKPLDIAVADGVVYVADTSHNSIVELSLTDGSRIKTLATGLHAPAGVAVDSSGDVWVADTGSNRVVELDPSGTVLQTFGSAGAGNSNFDDPTHLELFNGHLYVCDTYNDRVQVFDVSGSGSGGTTTQTFTGSVDAAGTKSHTFKITVTNTSVPIQATLSWPTTSANLNLFLTPPGATTPIASATSKTADPETLSFQPTVTGTYKLRVKAVTGASSYTLTASFGG